MALLADGSAPSMEEIQRYEAGIIEWANTEGIDLGAKATIARDQIVSELVELLDRNPGASGHGVTGRIVLTEPLRRWLVMGTLAAAYGDARLSQVSERYAAKWKDYRREASEAKQWLIRAGIGLASSPMPKPAAPLVETTAGSAAAGTYFFRYTWSGSNGQQSEPSDPGVATLAGSGGLRVSPGAPPPNATGWNIFAGYVESDLSLQNTIPLALGSAWEWQTGELADGPGPGAGQPPDSMVRVPNILPRG